MVVTVTVRYVDESLGYRGMLMTRSDSWLEGPLRFEGDERTRDDQRMTDLVRTISRGWRRRWPDADLYYTDITCLYRQDHFADHSHDQRALVVVFRGDERVADEHVFRRTDLVGQFHHRYADPAYSDRRRLRRNLAAVLAEYRRSAAPDTPYPALEHLVEKCPYVICAKLPYRSMA